MAGHTHVLDHRSSSARRAHVASAPPNAMCGCGPGAAAENRSEPASREMDALYTDSCDAGQKCEYRPHVKTSTSLGRPRDDSSSSNSPCISRSDCTPAHQSAAAVSAPSSAKPECAVTLEAREAGRGAGRGAGGARSGAWEWRRQRVGAIAEVRRWRQRGGGAPDEPRDRAAPHTAAAAIDEVGERRAATSFDHHPLNTPRCRAHLERHLDVRRHAAQHKIAELLAADMAGAAVGE
eukprot:394273-Prymnesium_polylepis.1